MSTIRADLLRTSDQIWDIDSKQTSGVSEVSVKQSSPMQPADVRVGLADGRKPEVIPLDVPQFDIDTASIWLLRMMNSFSDNSVRTSQQKIEFNMQQREELGRMLSEAIRESAGKFQLAAGASKSAEVFGWVGTIASVGLGIFLCATGVGAVAGGFMIAGAVLGVGSQIFNAAGGPEALEKSIGPDDAQKVMMGAMVLTIAVSAAGLGAGALSSSATLAANFPKIAALLASNAATASVGGASVAVRAAGTIAGSVSMVGGGASQIASTTYTYEGRQADARAKKTEGELTALQFMTDDQVKRVKKFFADLAEAFSIVTEVNQRNYQNKIQLARAI